ncbi:MAG: hypothetical protein RLZZ425_1003, partial [Bacteroidota bacterium]
AWEKLGNIADERGITRADLIENMMSADGFSNQRQINHSEIINILESALKLKANAGGAIKEKIRRVLKLLS